MNYSVRFGMLALLLFFLGVLPPATAYAEGADKKVCTVDPRAPYELRSSQKYADSGEWKNPIGKETIGALGAEGLRLVSIATETYRGKEQYMYWFVCGAPAEYEYQVLSPSFVTRSGGLLAKRRLEMLYGGTGKWVLVATIKVRDSTWYYLIKDKTLR